MPPSEIVGDLNFEEVIKELRALHKEHPTMRFGSLIQLAINTKKKRENFNLNDVSSKELFNSIKDYRQMLKKGSVKKPK